MTAEFSPDDLRQLRQLFIEEAEEHLTAIDEGFGSLVEGPVDTGALAALLRKLHTLKGSAGTVDLPEVSRDAHALEDRVAALRDATRPVERSQLEALGAGIERLRRRVAATGLALARVAPALSERTFAEAHRVPHAGASEGDDDTTVRRAIDALQIRVDAHLVDELMVAVSELVMDRTRISRRLVELDGCARSIGALRAALDGGAALGPSQVAPLGAELGESLDRLARAISGLGADIDQLGVTAQTLDAGLRGARMMEVGRLFTRFAVPLREAARRDGRLVEFHTSGDATAIDKALVERIAEPLLHLLRNAVAHGIEPPEVREGLGKPRTGRVEIAARQRGAEILIDVADDGCGLDIEALRGAVARSRHLTAEGAAALDRGHIAAAIFEPGVSTRDTADDLAGRGVGLDVVAEAIGQLGGAVACASTPGRGTRFTVRLPLTSAIQRATLFKVGGHVYAVPASAVQEAIEVSLDDVHVTPDGERLVVAGAAVPLLRLGALLDEPLPPGPTTRRRALLLEHVGARFAITCDKVIGPRDIVVKGLGPLLAPLPLFAGATISGAGKVQLVFDLAELAALAERATPLGARPTGEGGGPRVLFVDDAPSVREVVARMLVAAGYRVETAPDGWEAWERLQEARFDVLVTDGEMPRLDGYSLASEVRRHPHLGGLAILVVTSRPRGLAEPRARSVGADGFLEKPLQRSTLVEAIRRALARRAGAA